VKIWVQQLTADLPTGQGHAAAAIMGWAWILPGSSRTTRSPSAVHAAVLAVTRLGSVHLVTSDERCRTALNSPGLFACARLTPNP
jgi:hypothetical protein